MTQRPQMTRERLSPTWEVEARDQFGDARAVHIAGESPLTLIVDGRELVTLMTLGTYPEELAIGYLRNQRLIEDIAAIESVRVDWERETADIRLRPGCAVSDWEEKLAKRTVTSGCGQGTIFSCTLDKLYDRRLPDAEVRQAVIYELLREIARHNEIYKRAGAVHGCALCRGSEILMFVEDVGRHNAADAVAGMMWLEGLDGADKIFYTTGRLTSEIVMKTATMGIPTLLSRSGITNAGLEFARDLNITMLARAKGRSFLAYHGADKVIYDAKPPKPPPAPPTPKPQVD